MNLPLVTYATVVEFVQGSLLPVVVKVNFYDEILIIFV